MKVVLTMLLLMFPALTAYSSDGPTANEFRNMCNLNSETAAIACNAYFGGYLDGMLNISTAAEWNFGNNRLSVETIKNMFKKQMIEAPGLGDFPIGTVTTLSLVKAGILKEKKQNG